MCHEVAEQLEALQWLINQHLQCQATINWIIVIVTEEQFPVITVTWGSPPACPFRTLAESFHSHCRSYLELRL